MHIVCDISHPAHAHFFRNAIETWRARGNRVDIISRDKDITLQLLQEFGFEHLCLSRARRGLFGLGIELFEHQTRLYRRYRHAPPDVFLQVGGTFIVHAARLLRRPALVFYDTEHAVLANTITYPFATTVFTPCCYRRRVLGRHVQYEGYHELAYLHPTRFVPDKSVLTNNGLDPEKPYFVIRFVNWQASHDVGHSGFSLAGKIDLVDKLASQGQPVITSEDPLPRELEPYRNKVPASQIHHLLAFATLYIGESATMASESVVLGTPSVFVSPVGRGYTNEQERRYGMCFTISSNEETRAIDRALQLISERDLKYKWAQKRQQLLEEKIDVTAWLVDKVEEFGQ